MSVYNLGSMKKISLVSLGCAKNLVDSEVMLGFLVKNGYTISPDQYPADILIINTCGFIKPAKKEAIEAIQEALDLKKKDPSKKVIVTGCYVERDRNFLNKEFPDVDAGVGVSDFDKIVHVIEGIPFQSSHSCFLYDHKMPRILSTPSNWAYVKIS